MEMYTASAVERMIRGHKSVTKLINAIDKNGFHMLKIGSRGIEISVKVGDPFYYRLMGIKADLSEKLAGMKIEFDQDMPKRKVVAPVGACGDEEVPPAVAKRRAQRRAYYQRHKEHVRAYQREYQRKKREQSKQTPSDD